MHKPAASLSRSAPCGSVLILTLWILAILAALAAAAASQLTAVLRLARFLDNDLQAGAAARAGVELALAAVAAHTNEWDAVILLPDSGQGHTRAIGAQGRVRVVHTVDTDTAGRDRPQTGLIGAEARVNINAAHQNLLAALFVAAAGTDPTRAALWAGKLVEQRRALAELRTAEDQSLTKPAPEYYDYQFGFLSWHEVYRVKGMEPETLQAIRPYATLYGARSGRLNMNSAGITALTAAGLAADGKTAAAASLAENIVAFRNAGGVFDSRDRNANLKALMNFTRLTQEQQDLFVRMGGYLDIRSSCFQATAEGWMTAGPEQADAFSEARTPSLTRYLDFVIQREPRPRILYWHEY